MSVRSLYLPALTIAALNFVGCAKSSKSAGDGSDDSWEDGSNDNPLHDDEIDNVSENVIDELDWSDVSGLDDDSRRRQLATYVGYLSYTTPSGGYGRCTASLVAPTLVMTNEHCVGDAENIRVNFEYLEETDYDSRSDLRDEAYACDDIVLADEGEDVALVRCAPDDNDGRMVGNDLGGYISLPLTSIVKVEENDELYILHQNCYYESGSSCGWTPSDTNGEAIKKMSPGIVLQFPADDYEFNSGARFDGGGAFVHSADTLGGTSGSLVFRADDHSVVGLHHGGSSAGNKARWISAIVENVSGFATAISDDVETYGSGAGIDLRPISCLVAGSTFASGEPLTVSGGVSNDGAEVSSPSSVGYWLSDDASVSSDDKLLGESSIASLLATEIEYFSADLEIPAGLEGGTWYLFCRADNSDKNDETDESNNEKYDTITITSTSSATISLHPDNPTVTDSSPDAGDSITVSGTIHNEGTGSSGSFTAGIYLSTNSTWSSGDTELTTWAQSSISAGGSGSYSKSVSIPTSASGSYYIIVVTDPDDNIAEADEADNTGYRSISVIPAATTINLDPNSPSLSDSSPNAGDSIIVSGSILNDGTGATGSFTAGLYLSTNSTWSSGDTELTTWSQSSISAGGSGSYSKSVSIPSSASGSYYIIVVTDPDDDIAEADEADNTGYKSISVTPVASDVDLRPISCLTAGSTFRAGETVTVSGGISNDGSDTSAGYTVGFWLSTNTTLGSSDTFLVSASQSGLAGGDIGYFSEDVDLPTTLSTGTWYLFCNADDDDDNTETDEGDNEKYDTITIY